MQKSNAKVLIGLVVVVIIIAGGYAIFHKSGTTSSTANSTTSSTGQSQTSSSAAVVQTKTTASVGQYLADSSANPLYTYGGDTSGVSNCSGSCLYSWPIYGASSSTSLPTNVSVITRSDGSKQYAYKGMPLYTFTADSSGRVTGDGVSNFHVAKP
jgi:predicted lipoprotein with Yx(FWY)xxD motif